MKFMNNHYGQSLIFGRVHSKVPMNLQFFAEPGDVTTDGGGSSESNSEEGSSDGEASTPTIEELMTQLSEAKAESARLKLANDKASKEAAGYKKQLQAKMSAEERANQAENERLTALEEENKQMKAQMRMASYSKRYMGIGMDEKTAESLSDATGELSDPDKFFSSLDKFIQAKTKAAGEETLQKFLKDRPDIKAGSGTADKNSLAMEKARALAKNNSGVNEDILKHYRR